MTDKGGNRCSRIVIQLLPTTLLKQNIPEMCPMYSVLYVDDEKLLLDLCRTYLEKSGDFTVDTTDSVPAALEKIKDTAYDAIVSDYQMPETDGLTFLKEIRSQSGDIPFILFTGKGREEIVIDAINNGADFYIQKGGAPDSQFAELAHKIRKAVERKKAIEDLRENESQLRLLKVSVDWASDDVYWLDFEGKILYANESACRNTGYSREEFLAMTVFDLDPDFTSGMWDRSKKILKERKTNIFTTRHRQGRNDCRCRNNDQLCFKRWQRFQFCLRPRYYPAKTGRRCIAGERREIPAPCRIVAGRYSRHRSRGPDPHRKSCVPRHVRSGRYFRSPPVDRI